eukprot:gene12331-biopygen8811
MKSNIPERRIARASRPIYTSRPITDVTEAFVAVAAVLREALLPFFGTVATQREINVKQLRPHHVADYPKS